MDEQIEQREIDVIVDNIRNLYDTYGSKIKSEKHLLLTYWLKVDNCKINKTDGISTLDFLEKATHPREVMVGLRVYRVLEGGE